MILGVAGKSNSRSSHPPTERIHQLWEIYIDNIDPVIKIVHVPSLQPAIQKAVTDINAVPRSFGALMFAIYAAAVMSLKDDECKRRLGEPREILLSHYLSATKLALSRAKFMGTTSIVILQALVLHVFSIRHIYGPRTVWTLTGVAIRIAEGMGLHRDGASLGVPPFEAEIRRRIWWQLSMHEFRASELAGLAKFRGFDLDDNTCRPPANINDNELYPGMLSPPTSSTKLTDMMFCVLRTELASFARRNMARFRQQEKDVTRMEDVAAQSDQKTKDALIQEIEEILEAKYLRYCDPSQPIELFTMLTARAALNIVRFLTHHPRRWISQELTPESEREHVWKISIAILEQHDILQSDRRLQGFTWYTAYYLQWHVFIHVLDTLRARPFVPDAKKAWRLIEATYEDNPDMISNTKKPIHVAVGNLCLNAFNAYEAALVHQGKSIPIEAEYITKLRQQREIAKARRNARDARNKEAGAFATSQPSRITESRAGPDPTFSFSTGHLNANEPQQDISFQCTNPNQASESDQFWLTSGLDDSLCGTSGDKMNIDTDFMLAQDYNYEDATGQNIDWTQWDAWMSEINVAPADHNAGPGFVR